MIQQRRRSNSPGPLQDASERTSPPANLPVDASSILKKLEEDRLAYQDSLARTHELLAQVLKATSNSLENNVPLSPDLRLQRTSSPTNIRLTRDQTKHRGTLPEDSVSAGGTANQETQSLHVEHNSGTDEDESVFAHQPLPAEFYTHEGLRKHIRKHDWTEPGRKILGSILQPENMHLVQFSTTLGPVDDRSHPSHFTIRDVLDDGAPVLCQIDGPDPAPLSLAEAIWMNIQCVNSYSARQGKAVGRITVVREPSPLLFAALHYTFNEHFDMDEIFALLTAKKTRVLPHQAFSADIRQRQTFIVALNYFTIIGDQHQPMAWQSTMERTHDPETYIPIARCGSVIGLALKGEPAARVKNRSRAVRPSQHKYGEVYDPFLPWHVLNITAYPDWRSSIDSHRSTRRYVNGTEAFLLTLHAEYDDARGRLLSIHHRISDLVSAPTDSMFRRDGTDRLFFDDDDFSYLRKYSWASQALATMSETIHEMRITYQETFTADFWDGTSRTIWPTAESPRHRYWRKRMNKLRMNIESQIQDLEALERLNNEKTREIATLRQNLFSGTSVVESRKAVMQGQNIKTLTLVTIFFLPLIPIGD
ncbi:MAG: hypothetical protein Q9220_007044 [cf. Caloplaca sp. 1 TL-2023]